MGKSGKKISWFVNLFTCGHRKSKRVSGKNKGTKDRPAIESSYNVDTSQGEDTTEHQRPEENRGPIINDVRVPGYMVSAERSDEHDTIMAVTEFHRDEADNVTITEVVQIDDTDGTTGNHTNYGSLDDIPFMDEDIEVEDKDKDRDEDRDAIPSHGMNSKEQIPRAKAFDVGGHVSSKNGGVSILNESSQVQYVRDNNMSSENTNAHIECETQSQIVYEPNTEQTENTNGVIIAGSVDSMNVVDDTNEENSECTGTDHILADHSIVDNTFENAQSVDRLSQNKDKPVELEIVVPNRNIYSNGDIEINESLNDEEEETGETVDVRHEEKTEVESHSTTITASALNESYDSDGWIQHTEKRFGVTIGGSDNSNVLKENSDKDNKVNTEPFMKAVEDTNAKYENSEDSVTDILTGHSSTTVNNAFGDDQSCLDISQGLSQMNDESILRETEISNVSNTSAHHSTDHIEVESEHSGETNDNAASAYQRKTIDEFNHDEHTRETENDTSFLERTDVDYTAIDDFGLNRSEDSDGWDNNAGHARSESIEETVKDETYYPNVSNTSAHHSTDDIEVESEHSGETDDNAASAYQRKTIDEFNHDEHTRETENDTSFLERTDVDYTAIDDFGLNRSEDSDGWDNNEDHARIESIEETVKDETYYPNVSNTSAHHSTYDIEVESEHSGETDDNAASAHQRKTIDEFNHDDHTRETENDTSFLERTDVDYTAIDDFGLNRSEDSDGWDNNEDHARIESIEETVKDETYYPAIGGHSNWDSGYGVSNGGESGGQTMGGYYNNLDALDVNATIEESSEGKTQKPPEQEDSQDSLPELSDNVLFYQNKINSRPAIGHKVEDMLGWKGDYAQLEKNHSYIQWLFPIPGSHGMNYKAQALQEHEAEIMRNSHEIRDRVLRAFTMMLDFYGMKLVDEKVERNEDNWQARYDHLNQSFHNRMRITRIIQSLGELGFENLQASWLSFLMQEAMVDRKLYRLGGDSMQYFVDAIKADDERQKFYEKYFRYVVGDFSDTNDDNDTNEVDSYETNDQVASDDNDNPLIKRGSNPKTCSDGEESDKSDYSTATDGSGNEDIRRHNEDEEIHSSIGSGHNETQYSMFDDNTESNINTPAILAADNEATKDKSYVATSSFTDNTATLYSDNNFDTVELTSTDVPAASNAGYPESNYYTTDRVNSTADNYYANEGITEIGDGRNVEHFVTDDNKQCYESIVEKTTNNRADDEGRNNAYGSKQAKSNTAGDGDCRRVETLVSKASTSNESFVDDGIEDIKPSILHNSMNGAPSLAKRNESTILSVNSFDGWVVENLDDDDNVSVESLGTNFGNVLNQCTDDNDNTECQGTADNWNVESQGYSDSGHGLNQCTDDSWDVATGNVETGDILSAESQFTSDSGNILCQCTDAIEDVVMKGNSDSVNAVSQSSHGNENEQTRNVE